MMKLIEMKLVEINKSEDTYERNINSQMFRDKLGNQAQNGLWEYRSWNMNKAEIDWIYMNPLNEPK